MTTFRFLGRSIESKSEALRNFRFYGEDLLAPSPTTKLSTTPYSTLSQPPSASERRLLHPQPEHTSCRLERNPYNMDGFPLPIIIPLMFHVYHRLWGVG